MRLKDFWSYRLTKIGILLALIAAAIPTTLFIHAQIKQANAKSVGSWGSCSVTLDNGNLTISPSSGFSCTLDGELNPFPAWPNNSNIEKVTFVPFDNVTDYNLYTYYAPVDSVYLFSSNEKDAQGRPNNFWSNWVDMRNYAIFYSSARIDTSQVQNMHGMFEGASSLTNDGLSYLVSHFNTSNSNNMSYMFRGVSNVTNLDLSNFSTANVQYMPAMFAQMKNLQTLNLSSFNTSNVELMDFMFADVSSMTELNLSSFNTRNVNSMQYMFYGMKNLKKLTLGSNFATSNVGDMTYMFVTHWDDDAGTLLPQSQLEEINLATPFTLKGNHGLYGKWVNQNTGVSYGQDDYTQVPAQTLPAGKYIRQIDGGEDPDPVTGGFTALHNGDCAYKITDNNLVIRPKNYPTQSTCSLTSWEGNGTNRDGYILHPDWWDKPWANTIASITSASAEGTVYLAGDIPFLFADMGNLTSVNLSNFQTNNDLTSLWGMFWGAANLTSINNLSNIVISRRVNIAQMFVDVSSLTSLDLSGFHTYTAGLQSGDMHSLFSGMTNLNSFTVPSDFRFIASGDQTPRLPAGTWKNGDAEYTEETILNTAIPAGTYDKQTGGSGGEVDPEPYPIARPYYNPVTLTYKKDEYQNGVLGYNPNTMTLIGDNYSQKDVKATGNYITKIEPKQGYKWSTDGEQQMTFSWNINKADSPRSNDYYQTQRLGQEGVTLNYIGTPDATECFWDNGGHTLQFEEELHKNLHLMHCYPNGDSQNYNPKNLHVLILFPVPRPIQKTGLKYDGTQKFVVEYPTDPEIVIEGDQRQPIAEIGNYVTKFRPKNGYAWAGPNPPSTNTMTFAWSIEKGDVSEDWRPAGWPDQEAYGTEGQALSLAHRPYGVECRWQNPNDVLPMLSEMSGTHHPASIECAPNGEFENYNTNSLFRSNINVEVRSAGNSATLIARPTDARNPNEFVYDTSPHFGVNGYDPETMNIGGHYTPQTRAGEYRTIIEPKAGYAWSDTQSFETIEITWKILKADTPANYSYGDEQEITAPVDTPLSEIDMPYSECRWKDPSTRVLLGTHEYDVECAPGGEFDNYNPKTLQTHITGVENNNDPDVPSTDSGKDSDKTPKTGIAGFGVQFIKTVVLPFAPLIIIAAIAIVAGRRYHSYRSVQKWGK